MNVPVTLRVTTVRSDPTKVPICTYPEGKETYRYKYRGHLKNKKRATKLITSKNTKEKQKGIQGN